MGLLLPSSTELNSYYIWSSHLKFWAHCFLRTCSYCIRLSFRGESPSCVDLATPQFELKNCCHILISVWSPKRANSTRNTVVVQRTPQKEAYLMAADMANTWPSTQLKITQLNLTNVFAGYTVFQVNTEVITLTFSDANHQMWRRHERRANLLYFILFRYFILLFFFTFSFSCFIF